jgi:hypothetical protein
VATAERGDHKNIGGRKFMRWIQAYRAAKSFNHVNSIAEQLNWTNLIAAMWNESARPPFQPGLINVAFGLCDRPDSQTPGTILTRASCTAFRRSASC